MFPCLRQDGLRRLDTLLEGAAKVTVVGHTHPDGDALGVTSALALYLRKTRGKDVVCLFSDTPADNLRFILPPEIPFLFHDADPQAAEARIRETELIVLEDCNGFSRTDALAPLLQASKARKVLIDHHLNPESADFDLVFSTPDVSSACELLYWLLKGLGGPVSVPVGTALMTGMTTDTNNFANSVYPSTLQMASQLLELGVDRDSILQHLYQEYRENRVRIMGYMQHEGMQLLPEGAAYMILTRAIQERFDLREGESEGLVNVPLSIANVRLSVLLKENGDHFRVSVRSKKGTSAQQLAQRYFHGGGHENAAGGKLLIGADIASPEEAPAYLVHVLKSFLA
jgi:phosphoesterase RecJ-like protein